MSLLMTGLVALNMGCGDDGSGSSGDGGGGDGGVDAQPCGSDLDCKGDFYCDETAGVCVGWGTTAGEAYDPSCVREAVPGVFFPGVQCEWLGPPPNDPYPEHKNVLSTPMVVTFGGGADPELARPSIVFVSYNYTDGGAESCVGTNPAYYGVIRVIDGRTCEQQATIAAPPIVASSSVAVGDLTGDGVAEIVAARVGGGLVAFQQDGMGGFGILWQTTSNFGAGACDWAGPSIHDLDDDGSPEVLFYGAVFDADGNSLDESLGLLSPVGATTGYIPVVADVDADGRPELVTGAGIYGWDVVNTQWVLEQALGQVMQVAVADLGTFGADPASDDRGTLDGIAEIVGVANGTIAVYTIGGRAVFGAALPAFGGGPSGRGGPPTIADFDGDGRAEMATAGATAYTVFDLDCRGTPQATTCASLRTDGVLWSQPSQDLSSNMTGSSVFDFEGDGRAEAVYGDECFTRVYDGTTGAVVYSRFRTSCTWYENPVIADVDADYNAEIVITSNTNCAIDCDSRDPNGPPPVIDPLFSGVACFDESDCPAATTCLRDAPTDPLGKCRCAVDADCGGDGFVCGDPATGALPSGKVCLAAHGGPATATGVRVIADGLDRWVNTRRIWNQHAYAVTNVEEDGAIPRTSTWMRNWTVPGLNNFRQNAPGDGVGGARSPDLTVRGLGATCVTPGVAQIDVDVCNRGTEPVADGLAITVYAGAPPATVACVATTERDLFPGSCQKATCTWAWAQEARDLVAVADDAKGEAANTECREDNNTFVRPAVSCP